MSALFSIGAAVRLIILVVCTSTFLKRRFPSYFNRKDGWRSLVYKSCVIGDRLSPYVSILCFFVGVKKLVGLFI